MIAAGATDGEIFKMLADGRGARARLAARVTRGAGDEKAGYAAAAMED
jgi:hypothetical protein